MTLLTVIVVGLLVKGSFSENMEICSSVDCTFTNLKLKCGDSLIGRFQSGYHVSDVSGEKTYNFNYSSLPCIPNDFFASLRTYTKIVNMSSVQLKILEEGSFLGATSIEIFDVSYNLIEKLPKYVLKGMERIKQIDFSFNQINDINRSAFVMELPDLVYLDLSHNKLTTLNDGLFDGLNQLRILKLGNNLLTTVGNTLFEYNNELRFISLTGNAITNADFTKNKQLDMLDLSFNQLTTFQIEPKNELKELRLTNNKLNYFKSVNSIEILLVDDNALKYIDLKGENLKRLNVAHNHFNSIANLTNLVNASNLQYLDLSFNTLGPFDIAIFSGMKSLKYLDLEATNMQTIPQGLFSFKDELEFLDLSYNNLTNMDWLTLLGLHKLEKLFLNGNLFVTIDENFIEQFPNLQGIGLSNNNWDCETLGIIIKTLSKRNVQILTDKIDTPLVNVTNINGVICNQENFRIAKPFLNESTAMDHWNHRAESDGRLEMKINELLRNVSSVSENNRVQANSEYSEFVDQQLETMKDRLGRFEEELIALRSNFVETKFALTVNETKVSDAKYLVQQLHSVNQERFSIIVDRIVKLEKMLNERKTKNDWPSSAQSSIAPKNDGDNLSRQAHSILLPAVFVATTILLLIFITIKLIKIYNGGRVQRGLVRESSIGLSI